MKNSSNKSKRLKVALVFDDSLDRPDGVQQQLRLMAKGLAELGHEPVFICSQTELRELEGAKIYSIAGNFKVRANRNTMALAKPANKGLIKQVLLEIKPDIVHIMLPYSPWLGGRVAAAAKSEGIALFGTFHTYPSGLLQNVGSWLYGLVLGPQLRAFKQVYSVSSVTQQSVKSLFRTDTVIMPNSIDLAPFSSARAKTNKKAGQVLFLGRLVERKGAGYLVEAAIRARDEVDINYVIAGDGPLKPRLSSRIKETNVSNIKLAGFVPEAEKPRLLASAELAVFPATGGEAFGIVLIEAMAAGAVVLAGNNPGYASVMPLKNQLIEPTDVDVLAEKIVGIMRQKDYKEKLLKIQDDYIPQFDYRRQIATLEQDYLKALALKD